MLTNELYIQKQNTMLNNTVEHINNDFDFSINSGTRLKPSLLSHFDKHSIRDTEINRKIDHRTHFLTSNSQKSRNFSRPTTFPFRSFELILSTILQQVIL